jgi:hypothetical protein
VDGGAVQTKAWYVRSWASSDSREENDEGDSWQDGGRVQEYCEL